MVVTFRRVRWLPWKRGHELQPPYIETLRFQPGRYALFFIYLQDRYAKRSAGVSQAEQMLQIYQGFFVIS